MILIDPVQRMNYLVESAIGDSRPIQASGYPPQGRLLLGANTETALELDGNVPAESPNARPTVPQSRLMTNSVKTLCGVPMIPR